MSVFDDGFFMYDHDEGTFGMVRKNAMGRNTTVMAGVLRDHLKSRNKLKKMFYLF